MTYFTILHWIALFVIIALFILILILIVQSSDEEFPAATIFTEFLVMLLLSGFVFYGLDVYTKVAKLENITQKKILINESFSITGQIRNLGDFTIGTCTLKVEIFNDSLEKSTDGILFVPKSSFDNIIKFFKRDNSAQRIDTAQRFVIAENLHKGEVRNFSVFMRYPPSFVRPYTKHTLSCH